MSAKARCRTYEKYSYNTAITTEKSPKKHQTVQRACDKMRSTWQLKARYPGARFTEGGNKAARHIKRGHTAVVVILTSS